MSIISFRTPTAISAAGIAAAGAVIVALSPIAHADGQWGACAAPADATLTQVAICSGDYGEPDQATAERVTLQRRNSPNGSARQCTGWSASRTAARSLETVGKPQWAGGRGPGREDAEQDALRNLANGNITKSACVWPGPAPAPG